MSPHNFDRMKRVDSLILRALSDIIRHEVKDPRAGIISVTRVKTSKDLKYCKVYISVIGEDEQRKHTTDILNNLAGFLRHRLNEEVRLRSIPQLSFYLDTSVDYYMEIDELIKKTKVRNNNQ